MSGRLEVFTVAGIPEIAPGADLGAAIASALDAEGARLRDGDVVVVAQKVVSKAEGAVADLSAVDPSEFASRVAEVTGKDPRLVELVLRESVRIVRMDQGIIITETRHGYVCANAGVDGSNASAEGRVTLLPRDPDGSARAIRDSLRRRTGRTVAVIVSDSFGRPWREGSVNVAIGVAGMAAVADLRGMADDRGRVLRTSTVAVADELASAAQLVAGETGRTPVAIVRGHRWTPSDAGSAPLRRAREKDLFR